MLAPVLILLVFAIIEGALWLYARNCADGAAREGVSYLRLAGTDVDGYEANAKTVAANYARRYGSLDSVSVTVSVPSDPTTSRVTVTVSGTVVLPLGGTSTVTGRSSAVLEYFRGDTQ